MNLQELNSLSLAQGVRHKDSDVAHQVLSHVAGIGVMVGAPALVTCPASWNLTLEQFEALDIGSAVDSESGNVNRVVVGKQVIAGKLVFLAINMVLVTPSDSGNWGFENPSE